MLYYYQLIMVSVLFCFGAVAYQPEPSILSSDTVSLPESGVTQLLYGIIVYIASIEDSRCPADVNCIWAGRVKVDLLISQGTESRPITLILGPGQQLDSS